MCNLIAFNKEHNKGKFRFRVWCEFDKYPICKEH